MKTTKRNRILGLFLLIPMIIGLLLGGCTEDNEMGFVTKKTIFEQIEKAYFEGQKDALNGDIRIKKTSDSCYVWIKSPWDNKREPIYIPSICK